MLQPAAERRNLTLLLDGQAIKSLPIKSLVETRMPWAEYLPWIRAQAVSEWQRYLAKAHRYRA